MRPNKRLLTSQRRVLDAQLRRWLPLRDDAVPRAGWLRALRESLGLTHRHLATRMGSTPRNAQQLEERELTGAITLASMKKAARAMNCQLVYALVPVAPHASLEEIVGAQALALAKQLAGEVSRSMQLEGQGVEKEETHAQVAELAEDLRRELDSRIWTVTP